MAGVRLSSAAGRIAVGALAILALAPTSSALASHTQESIFQEDGSLASPNPARQDAVLNELKSLGVNTVRVLMRWDALAPNARSGARPALDLTDPNSYSAAVWQRYDNLVRVAAQLRIRVSLDPVGNLPRWAQTARCKSRSATVRAVCNPSPALFGQFLQAIGRRYGGSYPDPLGSGASLPRVNAWEVWNEPNQTGWLGPQFRQGPRGRLIPIAAAVYRRLALAAIDGLSASGHSAAGGDRILIGDTAPLGASYGPGIAAKNASPTVFLESVFCLDSRLHRLRGALAREQGCSAKPRMLEVSGFAHHPYQQGGGFSPGHVVRGDEITIAFAGRLERLLDAAARNGAITGPGLPIYYTEYGFQTNPPDRLLGIPVSSQAVYINESDYIAFGDPRIAGVGQYELYDDGGGGFHTGLRFTGGRAKQPSYDAYRLPIYVVRRPGHVLVWGQVRPADHSQVQRVAIQTRIGRVFTTIGTAFTANANGTPNSSSYFQKTLPGVYRAYRLAWSDPASGRTFYSRSASAYTRLP